MLSIIIIADQSPLYSYFFLTHVLNIFSNSQGCEQASKLT